MSEATPEKGDKALSADDDAAAAARTEEEQLLEAATLNLQRLIRRTLKKSSQRDLVAREITTSEKSYLLALNELVELYLRPLKRAADSGSPIISQDSIALIFSNIEQIVGINTDLYNMLEDRLRDWNEEKQIGDVFLLLAPHLRVYTTYCSNYTKALVRLTDRMNKAAFTNFLKKAAEVSQYPNLPNYLILPVQRIPRYQLLLRELQRKTKPEHPDFKDINSALEIITEVNVAINETIRDKQELEKLLALQKQFTGYCPPLYEPKRILVRDGPLIKICRKTPKLRHFFLFNDIMVYGTKIEAPAGVAVTYMFHRLISLRSAKIRDVKDHGRMKYSFQILGKEKSFTVCADGTADKIAWVASFNMVLAELEKSEPTKHGVHSTETLRGGEGGGADAAPVWVPDGESGTCMRCPAKFSFINRRHHCRQCGIIVCGKCSSSKFMLPNLKQLVRVCDSCFDELLEKAGGVENVAKSNYVRGSKYGASKSQGDAEPLSEEPKRSRKPSLHDRSISYAGMPSAGAVHAAAAQRSESSYPMPMPSRAPPTRPSSDGEDSSSDDSDIVDLNYDDFPAVSPRASMPPVQHGRISLTPQAQALLIAQQAQAAAQARIQAPSPKAAAVPHKMPSIAESRSPRLRPTSPLEPSVNSDAATPLSPGRLQPQPQQLSHSPKEVIATSPRRMTVATDAPTKHAVPPSPPPSAQTKTALVVQDMPLVPEPSVTTPAAHVAPEIPRKPAHLGETVAPVAPAAVAPIAPVAVAPAHHETQAAQAFTTTADASATDAAATSAAPDTAFGASPTAAASTAQDTPKKSLPLLPPTSPAPLPPQKAAPQPPSIEAATEVAHKLPVPPAKPLPIAGRAPSSDGGSPMTTTLPTPTPPNKPIPMPPRMAPPPPPTLAAPPPPLPQ